MKRYVKLFKAYQEANPHFYIKPYEYGAVSGQGDGPSWLKTCIHTACGWIGTITFESTQFANKPYLSENEFCKKMLERLIEEKDVQEEEHLITFNSLEELDMKLSLRGY